MTRVLEASVSTVILLLTNTVFAQAAPYEFECDAPEGRYSKAEIPIGIGIERVTGEISANEVRMSTKWAPGVNVILHNQSPGSAVGLRMVILESEPENIAFYPYAAGKENAPGFGGMSWKDEKIQFSIRVNGQGTIVKVGGASVEIEAQNGTPSVLTLGCSSGDFTINDVRVSKSIEK